MLNGLRRSMIVAAVTFAANLPIAVAADLPESIQAALDNPARPAADQERDAARKPGQVMAFAGIEPGMTVLDVFSGGGYYGELLSRAVGPEGRVIAHNNSATMKFAGEAFDQRYSGARLENVEHYLAEANDLDVGEGVADAVLLIQGFHDLYHFTGPKSGYYWPHIDPKTFLGNLRRSLKSGGVLAIIDHSAKEGAARGTGDTLHRVDPAIVREELELAGFEFIAEAGFLGNPNDTLETSVFYPAIRGKTDRFVHLYRKPE